MIIRTGLVTGLLLAFIFTVNASAGTIDFEDRVHGEIVAGQYLGSDGVTISVVNEKKPFDLAAAFNTNLSGTADPDLESPWDGRGGGNVPGNLPANTDLGNVLIISETNEDAAGDPITSGILGRPDDEGGRPAGRFIVEFDVPIHTFGWDLVDIENVERANGWFGAFYLNNAVLATVPFALFETGSTVFLDPSINFAGDNTANRITPITADMLSTFTGTPILTFDRVEIRLGGSGAIDNLVYDRPNPPGQTPVPLPSAVWAGVGLLVTCGLVRMRRRRRQAA